MNFEDVITGKNIEKSFGSFKLDVPELHIPKGFATALIGENAYRNNELNKFSDTVRAVRYDTIDYRMFFKWLSESMDEVSRSRTTETFTPGEMPGNYEYMD